MKRAIICWVVIILSFILIGYGLFCLTNSNKAKFLRAVKEYYSDKLDFNDKDMDKPIKITTNNVVKLDEKEVKVTGDIYLSKGNVYINFLSSILEKVDSKVEVYTDYKDLYFKTDLLSDELYKISGNNKNSEKDIKTIKNIVKDSIISNLSEKSFSKAKKTITFNDDVQLNTTEYTLKVRYVDVYNILLDLEKGLKANKATKSYFNDMNIRVEEYKKLLDSEKEMFTYSIYISKDKELVKQVIDFGIGNFTIIDYENDFDAKLNVSGSVISTLNIAETDKKMTFNLEINGSNIELIAEQTEDDKEYKMIANVNGKEALTSNFNITNSEKVPTFDTSKAIEMTENVKNSIIKKLKTVDVK